jgi:hypothetical protein
VASRGERPQILVVTNRTDKNEKPPRGTNEISTFVPARNFTIPLASRVRAAAGPPAYSVRKRRIEDLEEELVRIMREVIVATPDTATARRALEGNRGVARLLGELGELVRAHNRYYVVEANLPLDPRTGALLERGKLWEPLPPVSFDVLFARASKITE